MKTYLAHIVFLLLIVAGAKAQHSPVWSQYMTNGLPLNPGIAGSRDALNITATYRNQWVGFEGAPVTQLISAHTPLKNEKIALGLHLTRDIIGVSSSIGAMANAAYRIRAPKYTISMGLGVGAYHQKNDWNAVVTHQEGDDVFVGQTEVSWAPAASAGFYYYDKNNYVSLSAPFLVNGTENLPSDLKVMFNAGRQLTVHRDWKLIPSAMLRLDIQSVYQIDANIIARWSDAAEIGFSYRTNKTLIAMVRVYPKKQFAIGYAFDYLMSDLSAYEGGSHEITLSYDFKYKFNLTNPKFFH